MSGPWEDFQPATSGPWEDFAVKPAKKAQPESSMIGDALAGAVRGAGSIGATLLWPVDKITDMVKGDRNQSISSLVPGGSSKPPESRNEERRRMMDEALQSMGANPDSTMYKGGKLVGEIAGTAGAGGAVANGLSKIPMLAEAAPGLIQAIRTSGMSAGGAGLGTRMAGGAIAGGASAGMVDPKDALMGAGIGGALPGATKVAGMVGSSIGGALRGAPISPEVAALAKRAEELGINIPADRLVDSKPLNAIASTLNYVPFSGRAATESKMGSQLNQALSRTFGENSSNVTQALRQAEDKLGGKFDAFLKGNTVKVDQQFVADIADAANKASRELGADGASIIGKQVDDIMAKAATGEIDGQAAYNIKKTLDRIGNRNSPEAWYALDLKKKLMDALNRSVGPEQAQSFGQLRQQYGNMLDLQKIAKNGAEGEISVARLANMRGIKNDSMQELADIAAQFVKQREGQHGMAQRALVGGLTFGAGGLGGLLGGATVGRAANSALNSNAIKGLLTDGMPGLISDPAAQIGYRIAPLLGAGQ